MIPSTKVHHFSKIDTLQSQLKILTHQLDSLNKVTAKNTLSSEYFHDILTSQVTTFVLIVSVIVILIGYITWKGFITTFRISANNIKNDLNAKIKHHEDNFNSLTQEYKKEIKSVHSNYETLNNQTKRAIYAMLSKDGVF